MTGYQSVYKQKQTMKSNLHPNMKPVVHIMIKVCLQGIYFLRARKIKPAVACMLHGPGCMSASRKFTKIM